MKHITLTTNLLPPPADMIVNRKERLVRFVAAERTACLKTLFLRSEALQPV
jgi:hypothetical protein